MEISDKEKVKALIFDYGGTIDSKGDHWAEIIYEGYILSGMNISKEIFREAYVYAERRLAKERFIYPEHTFLDLMRIKIALELYYLNEKGLLSEINSYDSFTDPQIELINIRSGIDLPVSLIIMQHKISDYCYNYAKKCTSDALPVLSKLAEKYPMVLVSNFYGNIDSVLVDFGLNGFFKSIIESAVVGVRKPDPAIFSMGVKKTGFEACQVVVIGDSYHKDINPANSIGCKTIWIKGIGWDDKEDDINHQYIIKDLSELLNILI